MKILAIDTSGLICSVALSEDGILRALYSLQHEVTHSRILMPMLEEIREKLSLDMGSVDAVAAASGPGSFTGLRIGAATAKGLCLALDVPLIPVPTLDAMAYRLWGTDALVVPVMDARRDQVYSGIFCFENCIMKKVLPGGAYGLEALMEKVNELAESQGKSVIFLGDGVPVYGQAISESCRAEHHFAPFHKNVQSADAVAAYSYALYLEKGRECMTCADSFSPDYMRLSQAEREALEKENSPAGDDHTNGMRRDQFHIRTRLMVPEDLDAAAELEKEALGNEAWGRKLLAQALERDDTIYLATVLEDQGTDVVRSGNGSGGYREGDRLIGMCGVRNVAGVGEITNVAVDSGYRGRGTGKKMLKQLLERAKGIGAESFTLEVRKANAPARRLYEALGFTAEGERPGFYSMPDEDAVIYWKREEEKQ